MRSLLIIGSGPPSEITELESRVHERFPNLEVYAALLPDEGKNSLNHDCAKFVYRRAHSLTANLRTKLNAIQFCRSRVYDVVVVLVTGYVQYDNFKRLSVFSRAKKILLYNENMDSFFLDYHHRAILWNHYRWRKSSDHVSRKWFMRPLSIIGRFYTLLALATYGSMHHRKIRELLDYVRD